MRLQKIRFVRNQSFSGLKINDLHFSGLLWGEQNRTCLNCSFFPACHSHGPWTFQVKLFSSDLLMKGSEFLAKPLPQGPQAQEHHEVACGSEFETRHHDIALYFELFSNQYMPWFPHRSKGCGIPCHIHLKGLYEMRQSYR